VGWKWFYYLNPVPKGLAALALPQFECVVAAGECPRIQVLIPEPVLMRTDVFVADTLNASYDEYWYQIGWLILTIFVFRFLAYLVLKHVSHLKR